MIMLQKNMLTEGAPSIRSQNQQYGAVASKDLVFEVKSSLLLNVTSQTNSKLGAALARKGAVLP